MDQLLQPIKDFLHCETPAEWLTIASQPERLNDLLIDHSNCELKAAQTAIYLVRKYAIEETSAQTLLDWAEPYKRFVYDKRHDISQFLSSDAEQNDLTAQLRAKQEWPFSEKLMGKMVRLIKEEFHHFQQVLEIMQARGIQYHNITAGRYAKGLMKQVRSFEPAALVDKLIIGAFIEARSCERFAKLAPLLDETLQKFYVSLLRSEARHYQDYLFLAEKIAGEDIRERVAQLGAIEADLIQRPDDEFRFHSGTPTTQACKRIEKWC